MEIWWVNVISTFCYLITCENILFVHLVCGIVAMLWDYVLAIFNSSHQRQTNKFPSIFLPLFKNNLISLFLLLPLFFARRFSFVHVFVWWWSRDCWDVVWILSLLLISFSCSLVVYVYWPYNSLCKSELNCTRNSVLFKFIFVDLFSNCTLWMSAKPDTFSALVVVVERVSFEGKKVLILQSLHIKSINNNTT